ncbi:hypothetical protein BOTBODRAFT_264465 [Botryobasidium botryosum FD-172 SS1]|uniref:Uncharacterized protein n=1 Tax=Botryobasidium botryosum (strain FD-172 SS1) TaxID=930990 RepID=A0A067M2V5_BOTB1|nr:hypothetical protein BOTBODRAFT_264465 [Botryobasidium botryosum FD-172 SS1]
MEGPFGFHAANSAIVVPRDDAWSAWESGVWDGFDWNTKRLLSHFLSPLLDPMEILIEGPINAPPYVRTSFYTHAGASIWLTSRARPRLVYPTRGRSTVRTLAKESGEVAVRGC